MKETGLIHIYCGDGKGKTTASIGLAVRCMGGGGKVMLFQFLKSNSSGERRILEQLPNATVIAGSDNMKFSFVMSPQERHNLKDFYESKMREIKSKLKNDNYQLLVLDEILAAISEGFVEEYKVIEFLKSKPEKLEVVLTGRNPSKEMMDIADYVSSVSKIKHPFDMGIDARKLIEF